ncbi:MAG: hypothetical protein FIB07_03075 [Candidatus Methanoperedens sp.]|nr:hypothetical protein [Candidatus Methanoperedens sp.]
MEKFKIYLDNNRQINLKIEDKEFKITNSQAQAIRYELYRIIGIQSELIDLDYKPNYVEEEMY